jgi:class 3 adenylate cyclase
MTPRTALLTVVSTLRFIAGVLCYAAALGFLALFVAELLPALKPANAPVMVRLDHLLGPAVVKVSTWFGWRWPTSKAVNFAPLILAVAAVVARSIVDSFLLRADFRIRRMLKTPARVRYAADSNLAQPQHRYQLSADSEAQRAVLLKRYREIEDALKSASRKECSFLSIDVVGSTKMKLGERKTAIDATFQAYEELVKETFQSFGVWKETWTPDGVMACFLSRDLAVNAAQEILSALEQFNREENQLRTPIKIRCGLNDGEVTIFEDSSLEKVADHAIDIAGHMQKYAEEDALQISAEFYAKLNKQDGFTATGREVDGLLTYEWRPPVAAGMGEPQPVA